MTLTREYDYVLPVSAIAQTPSARRDRCRLAVIDPTTDQITHGHFSDLPNFLAPGDVLVLNDSRVLPARIPTKRASGGAVEVFLLEPARSQGPWPAFLRPASKVKDGEALTPTLAPSAGIFRVLSRTEQGVLWVTWEGRPQFGPRLLNRIGLTPTPPYIQRSNNPDPAQRKRDAKRYQTVYAAHAGSVAAPTAGLHFTPGLLRRCQAAGATLATVTLHVAAGTFLPVKTEALEDHPMHAEHYQVPIKTWKQIQNCRQKGARVIAVGTTALRALESEALRSGAGSGQWNETKLFVIPPYRFRLVDSLITNFHQPRSTLLPLVSAFATAGRILEIYASCLQNNYQFLSYGDAMLINSKTPVFK